MELEQVLDAAEARSSALTAIIAERDCHATWFDGVRSAYDAYYDRPRPFPYDPGKGAEIEAIEAAIGAHAERLEELKERACTAHGAALAAVGKYTGTRAASVIEADATVPTQIAILDGMTQAAQLRRDHIDGLRHSMVLSEPGPLTMSFLKALLEGRGAKASRANLRSMVEALRQPLFLTAPAGTETLMRGFWVLEGWAACDDGDVRPSVIARCSLGDELNEALDVLGQEGIDFRLTALNPHLRLHPLPTEIGALTDQELRGAISQEAWFLGGGRNDPSPPGWTLEGLREALREREVGGQAPRP